MNDMRIDMKTCSGRLEREKNFEDFLEKASLSLFDPSLLSESGASGKRLKAKKLVERKLEERGVGRKLSFLASELFTDFRSAFKPGIKHGIKHGERESPEHEFSAYGEAFDTDSKEMGSGGMGVELSKELSKIYREARREAWRELKELISCGIDASSLDVLEVIDTFEDELLEELEKAGYLEGVERGFSGRRSIFSGRVEKLIARKVLEIALRELEAGIAGETESEKPGFFTPSFGLRDYDESVHTFDMIDLQESLISELLATGRLEIGDNAVVREFERLEKVVHVILIDSSDSMKGGKLRSAIKAALALKEVAKERSKTLRIFAFSGGVRELREGEIVNLVARGRTNIALALKRASDVAVEMNATPVVYLITDGEPTSPENPVGSAIRAAEMLGRIPDSRLTVIMLDREGRYADFCRALTARVRKSSFVHLNPSDLTVFMLKCFY